MYRKVCVALCLVALVLTAGSVHANLLVNGSFEQFDNGWTMTGSRAYYGGGAPDGHWDLAGGGKTYNIYSDCNASQHVSIAPGIYRVDLSLLYNFLMPGPYDQWQPSSSSFMLTVDGIDVVTRHFTAPYPPHSSSWNQLDLTWTGNVAASVGVRMRLGAGYWQRGSDYAWYPTLADKVVLNATPVPEPSSFMALLCGAGAVLGLRKRSIP